MHDQEQEQEQEAQSFKLTVKKITISNLIPHQIQQIWFSSQEI